MPHTGLTWFRLKEHLRKCLPIYLAGFVVCILLTNLLYTSTRPVTPSDQAVLVYLTDSYTNPEPLSGLAEDALAYGQTVDETLQEVAFESLSFNDPEQDYTSSMLLVARLSTGDGDVFLASPLAADYLCRSEAFLPLEEYLDAGWMEDLGLEPLEYTSAESGETHVAGLKLDSVTALRDLGAFNNEGACLIIAANGTNIDTSMAVAEHILKTLLEGDYASAQSTQPAA